MSAHEILEDEKKYRKREYHIFFKSGIELTNILLISGLEYVTRVYSPKNILIPPSKTPDGRRWSFNVLLMTEQEADVLLKGTSTSRNVHLIDSSYLELLDLKPSDMLNKLITEHRKQYQSRCRILL